MPSRAFVQLNLEIAIVEVGVPDWTGQEALWRGFISHALFVTCPQLGIHHSQLTSCPTL